MKISLLLLLLPFFAIAQADLVLTVGSEVEQTEVDRGEILRLNLRIENQGNQRAIATSANIYLSADKNLDGWDLARTFGIGDLESGEYVDIPILYDIWKDATPGSYYVLVKLDATNKVSESNESNLYALDEYVTILSTEVSYTKLPYPIILVHGWEGNSETWDNLKKFYEEAYGLIYGGQLPFCLNMSETSTKYWEDISYFPQPLGSGDFYVVNFDVSRAGVLNASDELPYLDDVKSNQAAIYKQGRGVKWAVEEVLKVTGAEKVILIGHSMGGLASRQYLQNPENWQSDGHHHVSKLLTIATPNGGSNYDLGFFGDLGGIFLDKDQNSDAVRDMRFNSNEFVGVFLDGGYENWIGNYFKNQDVNCDGDGFDEIIGLNNKIAPSDLEYSSIVGAGVPIDGVNFGDGVVSFDKANIKDFVNFENPAQYDWVETFNVASLGHNFNYQFHSKLVSDSRYNVNTIRGQDESEYFVTAPTIEKSFLYQGVITAQTSNSIFGRNRDIDSYRFVVEKKSDITIHLLNLPVQDVAIQLYNSNYDLIGQKEDFGHSVIEGTFRLAAGEYFVDVSGFEEDIDGKWRSAYYIAFTGEEIEEVPLQVSIDNNIKGGCGDYTYEFNGSAIGNVTSWSWRFEGGIPSTSKDQNPRINYEAPGTYNVELEISNANQSTKVNQTITVQERKPSIKDIVTTNDNCGFKTGAISVLMDGSNADHTFNWSNGNQSAHQTNLEKGSYEVTIQNSFGCEVTEVIELAGAERFKLNVSSEPISCWGESDGSINIAPQGGTSPYEITVKNPQNNIIDNLTNLSSGGYTVVVKDANGCPASSGIHLVNPPKIEVAISFRERNGKTETVADVRGGTRPYEIIWSNGSIGNFTNQDLASGATVAVTDASGCKGVFDVIDLSTGIEDLVYTEFKVFPNPTIAEVNVYLELPKTMNLQFKLYNSTGMELKRWSKKGSIFKERLSLLGFSSGAYLLNIQGDNGSLVRRIIKVNK